MKALAVGMEGSIQYIEIPTGRAFFVDGCWNIMNDQNETERSLSEIGRPSASRGNGFKHLAQEKT